jgi:8-oxo-dGTP diphosphatase
MSETRFTLRSASYLLLIKDNNIFLIRRFNTGWQDGNYTLPSGHLNGGETAREAMSREAKEEIGITIDPKDLEVIHVLHRRSVNETVGNVEYVDFYLTAKKWIGEPTNVEPTRCDHAAWFPLTTLPSNLLTFVRLVIENYHKHIFYSEFGWGNESY